MTRRTLLVFLLVAVLGAIPATAATIGGTAGADTLRGGPGADTISGQAGPDKLYGAGGNDVLIGGPGNDLLVGGPGADTLRCGRGRDTAARDALDTVAADCEVVRGPRPSPPPPAPEPPPVPSGPGAPATYVFGPEVTPAQQARIREGLDIGARYFRAVLGAELPPFSVWAYGDLETLVRVFAETAPTDPANARNIWTRGTVASADYRKVWFGPTWLSDPRQTNATKIAVHEAFHVLQYELAGPRSLNSGFDDVPRAGPRWLSEGSAELVAYLALAANRLTAMTDVRREWALQARSSSMTLQGLAVLRGQFEAGSNAWGIMPLAVERLVGEAGLAKLSAYFAAIGRGEAWQSAFATAFGRTVDAFYAEFAAYRAGL